MAALAALESLLSATVADGMSVDERHDPDRELFGQGLANLASPMFGGMPATAAIARTAVNVRAGAGSKLAALTHALVLAVIVLARAGSVVALIPLAALAGVLLATTVRMVEPVGVAGAGPLDPRDAAVLGADALVTVAVDLVTAVAVGVGVAVVLALRAVAKSARSSRCHWRARRPLRRGAPAARRAHRRVPPRRAAVLRRRQPFLPELTDVADVAGA